MPRDSTDVGLQLLEGERVLLRPHRKLPGAKVLELAARVATDRHDQPTLEAAWAKSSRPAQPAGYLEGHKSRRL